MSTLTYEQEYRQVLADVYDVQQEDIFLNGANYPSDPRSKNSFFLQFRVSMYIRYLQLAKRLTVLHNVELQPQKLVDVRTMLDGCLGRMLELKHHLVDNCGDYFSLDNFLLDMKITPNEAEVPIPSYILDDRIEELKDRRNVILALQRYYAESELESPVAQALSMTQIRDDPTKAIPALPVKKQPPPPPKTLAELEEEPLQVDEAVSVLQICERGRQARQRAKFQLSLYHQQRYASVHGQDFNTVTGKDRAATVIQTVVHSYIERKKAIDRFREEELFLGLKPKPVAVDSKEAEAAARRVQERKARQTMNVMALRQKTTELKANIKASEGPKSMETMLDEILLHMAYARLENKDGQLVELPSHEEGGSLKMLGKLGTEKDKGKRRRSIGSKRGSRVASDTGSIQGGKDSVAAGSVAGSDGKKKKGRKEDEEMTEPLPNSAFWSHMQEGKERYDHVWKQKFINTYLYEGNMDLPCDEAVIRQQLLEGPRGIMHQLRHCVDDLVMMEVSNLKERLEWEKKNKRKKPKKPKKPKAPKKPKLKDPAKGVDLSTMTNTLVFENKLQLPPSSVRVADFIGTENLIASPWDQQLRARKPDDELKKKWMRVLRGWNEQVELSLKVSLDKMQALFDKYLPTAAWLSSTSPAELRRAVTEYAILPLGSQVINDMAPHKRTMLFYGFPATGKTMMAYAICNESGANFFNLSPQNFRAMKGIAKVIQTVFYLARMKGPSVIYIENVEKIFPGKGKKKKVDGLVKRGKKMKKEIVKGIASLLPTDRVIVVFVSNEPWGIDRKAIEGVFNHGMYFAVPDYASRMELLKTAIDKKLNGRFTSIDQEGLQQLTILCDGYSVGQLQSVVDVSLYPRRIQAIPQRQLEAADFIAAVSVTKAPTPDEVRQMTSFHESLPVHLRRANPTEDFPESEEDAKRKK